MAALTCKISGANTKGRRANNAKPRRNETHAHQQADGDFRPQWDLNFPHDVCW